jgi:hypothetical protein
MAYVVEWEMNREDPSATTCSYTHVASEDDARSVEQLEAILRPNSRVKEK